MLVAFRKKTRSDEVVIPEDFRPGMIVWVEGENGREQYICINKNGPCIPADEYRSLQARIAEENRAKFKSMRFRRKKRFFGFCH